MLNEIQYSIDPLVTGGAIRAKLKANYNEQLILGFKDALLAENSILEFCNFQFSWNEVSLTFKVSDLYALSEHPISLLASCFYNHLQVTGNINTLTMQEKAFLQDPRHRIYLIDVLKFDSFIKIIF